MNLPYHDVHILRALARRVAERAADERNLEKAALWSRLTGLDATVRPLPLDRL